ncbi:hypothetical protein BGW38_004748 [Lunasporangiospora selenospora]|uniref:Uncharacterized protein n=1 Tax=Lunasporangiospora selenospora TaxID=979761 RepID=A0A9P6KHL5_9FUNG|nr:hypothetical protein BGW38_004748 [Lunasporangiospora selenospora]
MRDNLGYDGRGQSFQEGPELWHNFAAFTWLVLGSAPKEDEDPGVNVHAKAGAKRLLRGNSRVMSEYDYALVENTLAKPGQNPIVACASLQKTSGYYGKTHLQYGKLELIGTLPDFRGRSLVSRLIFEMLHPASEARGDLIQMIPGVPYFYRRFGYEYALKHQTENKCRDISQLIPKLEEGAEEPVYLRIPTLDDVPYLMEMSTPERRHIEEGTGTFYDQDYWQFTVHDMFETAECEQDIGRVTGIIVDSETNQDIGIVMAMLFGPAIHLKLFALERGRSYRDVLSPVLRQLLELIEAPLPEELIKQFEELQVAKDEGVLGMTEAEKSKTEKVTELIHCLPPGHPAFQLLAKSFQDGPENGRLFTRINSYPKFLLKVAPTLEDRLANSGLAGITATWHIDFYHKSVGCTGSGLEVVFEKGRIILARDWVPPTTEAKVHAARARIAQAKEEGRPDEKPLVFTASFAPLTFTRLVVGDLSIDEMLHLYTDCVVDGVDAKLMLQVLFPKQVSDFDIFWW